MQEFEQSDLPPPIRAVNHNLTQLLADFQSSLSRQQEVLPTRLTCTDDGPLAHDSQSFNVDTLQKAIGVAGSYYNSDWEDDQMFKELQGIEVKAHVHAMMVLN